MCAHISERAGIAARTVVGEVSANQAKRVVAEPVHAWQLCGKSPLLTYAACFNARPSCVLTACSTMVGPTLTGSLVDMRS